MESHEVHRLIALGEASFTRGDLDKARSCFEETLQWDPHHADALNNLGVIAFHARDTHRAIECFVRCLEQDPFHKDAILNFVDLLRPLGMLYEAVPYLERATERHTKDDDLKSVLAEARGLPLKMLPWRLCYSPGITHHGESARRLLGLEQYIPSIHLKEPVWFFGLYFDTDYLHVKAHQGRKVINWRGADALRVLASEERLEVVRNVKGLHVCQAHHQKELLSSIGLTSIVRPMTNMRFQEVRVTPFPTGTTAILVYWRRGDDRYIQASLFFEIASRCPDVTFHIVGQEDPSRFTGRGMDNIRFHGFVSEERLDVLMDRCKGTIRPWLWDGNPNIQTKMLLKGRYAAHSCLFEKVTHCRTVGDYVDWIQGLQSEESPNLDAREWWLHNLNHFDFLAEDFSPEGVHEPLHD